MRRRHIVVISSLLVAVLFIGIWLSLRDTRRQAGIAIGFTTARGHFPEPGRFYDKNIIVAWVTNTGRSTISLDNPMSQYEIADGRVITDLGSSWNLKTYSVELTPGEVAWLPTGFDEDRRKVRFVFEYYRNGGFALRAISMIVRRLPWKHLSQQNQLWLRNHGMIDGFVHVHYESNWITNEVAQGTR